MPSSQSLAEAKPKALLRALVEMANLPGELNTPDPDAVRRFLSRWPDFFSTEDEEGLGSDALSVVSWRDDLRQAWRGGEEAGQALGRILFSQGTKIKYGDELEFDDLVVVDWRRAELVYKPLTPFQQACYLLLKNSHLAKVCANPDCRAPYFIARRAIRRYCSPACLKPFQKQWKRSWWDRVGNKRRKAKHKGGKR